jgi:aldehyde dehydrogenase (NAD+)
LCVEAKDRPTGGCSAEAMHEHDRLYIGGDWVAPATAGTIDIVSPHTEQVVGRVPEGTPADIDRAVSAARQAFDHGPWPRREPADRAATLARLAAILERRKSELGALVTAEMGAPISQPLQAEAVPAVWGYFADLGARYAWEERREGALGAFVVRREPVGVVAAIVPWNVPQTLAALKLAPALVAGCTAILKPAPETPLDAYLLAEMVDEAGIPPGVVNIVAGGRETGEHLVAHPGVDKVAFTGSVAAGRRVGAICGEQLKRCTLELGGKSAAILCDDADVGAAVGALRFASLAINGQACAAQTRILAPRSRYGEVVDALAETVGAMKVGDPADPETEIGPLVARRQQKRVTAYIRVGRDEGARLVTGGAEPPLDTGWYVAPTVFAGVDNSMRIAREEIFGPVLSVIPYDGDDDAVQIAGDSEYDLAGSVWTADAERGHGIARRVRTGTYGVNTFTVEPSVPFGGLGRSGVGREGGPEGLAEYVETRAISAP